MADEDKKARIILEFDNGEFKVKVDDSIDHMNRFGASGESVMKRVMFNAIGLNQTLELGKKLWEFTAGLLEKPIEAAAKQESAIQKLNQSLANAGTYSRSASNEMQEFAEQMSRTTKFSDDTVLGLEAYARTLTKSNEQAVKLTKAALEMSAATGVDAHDAVQRLGLSLNGINARLDRSIPSIRGMTAAMLASGAAIDEVNRKFAGSAAGGLRTFEGLRELISHGIEELNAAIGKLITNSPGVKAIMTIIADGLFKVTDSLKGLKGDIVGDLIKQMFDLGKSVITYGMAPLEMLGNIARIVITGIKLSIQTFITELAMIPSYLAEYVVAPITALFSKDAGDSVKNFAKNARETLIEETGAMATDLGNAWGNALDFSASSKTLSFVDTLSAQYDKLRASIKGVNQENNASGGGKTGLPAEIQKMVQTGIVSTLSSSFAALGGALVSGKNAFQAFGKAFLSAIGQMAIQIGTFMVQLGLGYATMVYIPPWAAAGAATVIKGLALITLGGALSAAGGGGGGGEAAGGGGGSSYAPTGSAPEPVSSAALEKRRGDIVFNGPVFNSRETQKTMVELIREGSDITDWNIIAQGGKSYT